MSLHYIDLFAGAGGLSEGFFRAGYKPIAHVEMDEAACRTLKTRSAYYYLKERQQCAVYEEYLEGKIKTENFYKKVPESVMRSVIQAEISDETLPAIFKRIDELRDGKNIDLIIGGPPCQVYSLVGRARLGEEKAKKDVRYTLYKQYAEFLNRYMPKLFVFENVQGLLSADNGDLLKTIHQVLEACGYRIDYRLLNASEFGVLQTRKRVIIIGRKGDPSFRYPAFESNAGKLWTVGKAIFSDLPLLKQGEAKPYGRYGTEDINAYLQTTGLRNDTPFVSQHITRPHNERDLEIYRIAIEKWLNNRERLRYNDLPEALKTHKNQTDFLDRFKVVDPEGLSHTVVAHLSKDGHYFIYPDANNPRSLSVREAARIQSFPDDFYFEGGRTGAFRQIGNAVPPLLGQGIANKLFDLF